MFGWADRFRQGASSFGDQSTAFGKDAARYGSAALTRVTEETEQRPLMAIAVALGVGILIGMAARGRSLESCDGFELNRHRAPDLWRSMIFSETRCRYWIKSGAGFFRIML